MTLRCALYARYSSDRKRLNHGVDFGFGTDFRLTP